MSFTTFNILAISGSLKAGSVNTALLHELAAYAENKAQFHIYTELELLPAFNPDREAGNAAVQQFKALLRAADGILISTPEYAFGLPGALKNALDWTVSSGELNDKPVAAISASPLTSGGDKAMAALLLTLSALGTKTTPQTTLCIPVVLTKMNAQRRVSDAATLQQLQAVFDQLLNNIEQKTA